MANTGCKIKCLAFILVMSSASASVQFDAYTIIQCSVQANNADWKAAPAYDYSERDQENGVTKTYDEMMILGSPYEHLVAVNGKALTTDEEEAEQSKLRAVTSQRRLESAGQRALRIAKYDKDRKRDHLLMDELAKAFDFRLLGQQKLGPYDLYVLKATPRADYKPPNMEAQVLTAMQGKLWIDEKTFQWVKVEAQVIHAVSIEGFLARVEPGTRFELEKMPVADGIWLPRHFAMKSRAKVLFLFTHNTQEDETYFDYHKAPTGVRASSR
jgi:hypothetical protein